MLGIITETLRNMHTVLYGFSTSLSCTVKILAKKRTVKSHLESFKEGMGLASLQSLLLSRAFPPLFYPCLDFFHFSF